MSKENDNHKKHLQNIKYMPDKCHFPLVYKEVYKDKNEQTLIAAYY